MVRKERIERVKREQKRGEESEQSRETQGFALAGRRSHRFGGRDPFGVAGVLLWLLFSLSRARVFAALVLSDIFVMHIREYTTLSTSETKKTKKVLRRRRRLHCRRDC